MIIQNIVAKNVPHIISKSLIRIFLFF